MANVLSVSPDLSLNSILPQHDFADALMIRVAEPALSARAAAERAFQRQPGWFTTLLALRNGLARIVGLRSTAEDFGPATQLLGGFPLVSETPERVVMGFDDLHLDFRIVIDANSDSSGTTTVLVSTLVHTHNLMGRAYLSLIMPFHKLIGRTLTAEIGKTPSE